MSPTYDDDDIHQELREIDVKLRNIEKTTKSSSEEHLFFGIAFSLLILFLTLPINDLASFLQNLLPLSLDLATRSATGIRGIGIIFSLAASLLRYYGSMCGEHKCKRMRLYSICSLWMGFNFFVLIIGLNTFSAIAIKTSWVTIPLGLAFLTAVFFVISLLEKRMLNFYAIKHLVFKSESVAIVSLFFMFLCAAFYVGLVLGIFSLFSFPVYASAIQTFSSFAILFGLLALYIRRTSRKSTRRDETRRGKPFQSKMSRWL